jgi:hypothetical protein
MEYKIGDRVQLDISLILDNIEKELILPIDERDDYVDYCDIVQHILHSTNLYTITDMRIAMSEMPYELDYMYRHREEELYPATKEVLIKEILSTEV